MKFNIPCIPQRGPHKALHMSHCTGGFKGALQSGAIGKQDADKNFAKATHTLFGLCLAHFGGHHGRVGEFVERGGKRIRGSGEIGDCGFEKIIRELDTAGVEASLGGTEEMDGTGLENLEGELFGGRFGGIGWGLGVGRWGCGHRIEGGGEVFIFGMRRSRSE